MLGEYLGSQAPRARLKSSFLVASLRPNVEYLSRLLRIKIPIERSVLLGRVARLLDRKIVLFCQHVDTLIQGVVNFPAYFFYVHAGLLV